MAEPLTTTYRCPNGAEFPVTFEEPEHERFGWRWDQMHCPLPYTTLSIDFNRMGEGFNRAGELLGAPAYGERTYQHGYLFGRAVPYDGDPELRASTYRREMDNRADRILELWNEEYRPEVEALTGWLLGCGGQGLTLRQLVDRLDQLLAVRRRLGELHQLTMLPASFAANRFIDLCVAEFDPKGEQLAGELMQGFPSKSLESAAALWELSREAKERPAVEDALRTTPPADVLAAFERVGGGPSFLDLLRAFLDEYGWRNEAFNELSAPMWREDPSFPLFTLRRYLELPEESSPAAMHDRAAKHREELTAETERRLAAEPEKLETFRAWQTSGQQRTVLLEDHNFYIDQKSHVAARIPCLAIGRRLAEQGAIDSPDEVFYLTEQDMQNAALDQSARYQAVVAERRAERARWMHTLPPATIGEGAVELSLAMTRFFGPTGEEPVQDGVIKGIAASAGVVRGTARVIRTLDEVERLAAGEILVAYATAPPWTPLFAVASAVVTDTGGMLSHCAVVAREYGLPAVVGTKVATQRIEDGMLITVDGGNGTVRIER